MSKTRTPRKTSAQASPIPVTPRRTPEEEKMFEAEQKIKDLQEQLATLNEGQHVSREDYDKLDARLRSEQ